MTHEDPGSIGAKLQEVWREIIQAEHARGSATAGAQAAYEEALRRFRHMQLEAFTVSLGELVLLREMLEELTVKVEEVTAMIKALEAQRAREIP